MGRRQALEAWVGRFPEPVRDVTLAASVVTLDLIVWSDLFFSSINKASRSSSAALLAVGLINVMVLIPRRRVPLTVLVVTCAISATAASLHPFTYRPIFTVCVALATVISRRKGTPAVTGMILAMATSVAWTLDELSTSLEVEDLSVGIFIGVGYLVVLLVAAGIGRWSRAARQRLQLMDERRQQEARMAVAAERLRLARELHDIVAHAVTVMVLQAGGARRIIESDLSRAEAALETVEEVGLRAMSELRRLLGVLRATGEEGVYDNASLSGIDDLPSLMATVRGTGLEVSLEEIGERRNLDASVDLAAFRVVQEALTNVSKHAGPGATAVARLQWTQGSLVVEVQDDGAGSGPQSSRLSTGHGLLGLRERVNVAGGELSIQDIPDSGFMVKAVLPVAVPAPQTAESGSSVSPQSF